MASMSNLPSNLAIYIVEYQSSIDSLIRQIYEAPDEATVTHFKWINNHLVDDIVRPGQAIDK